MKSRLLTSSKYRLTFLCSTLTRSTPKDGTRVLTINQCISYSLLEVRCIKLKNYEYEVLVTPNQL